MFLSPAANISCEVLAVEGLVVHKNVALGALGVGLVTLLHDQYCVLHMEVHKVNPEVGPV